ncbi:uncharacterized protein EV422DRAFT_512401 [Fimicolochytrium jonesii]|uniref:uncharacterized protein n=1 Tax=Fimicolochytrium jonesii TaxID=1396493 RepID=UPI0022FE5A31|nr:uncharacterized protein EV422DRAFT_512401 [Fimicolochytrium jonesii]KAI8827032.1 hypothetical protein EV422DRAFT_512401 [Fimicolochytrium jonesii]
MGLFKKTNSPYGAGATQGNSTLQNLQFWKQLKNDSTPNITTARTVDSFNTTTSKPRAIALSVDLETRKAHTIVLGLVVLDFLISLAALYEALYDPASPSALDPHLNVTKTLHTSRAGFTGARVFLFAASLLIRTAFLIEIIFRLLATGASTYLRLPYNIFDALIVLLAFFLHMTLPAREALIVNPIILCRLWRVIFWVRCFERELSARFERDVTNMRRTCDIEMGQVVDRNRELEKKLTVNGEKMRVLLGDVGIVDMDITA